MPSGIPDGTPLDMRIGYSPDGLSGGRFAGYIESLKIYTDNLPEAWLQLSRQAEYDDSLLERSGGRCSAIAVIRKMFYERVRTLLR